MKFLGWIAILLFLASIPFANWFLKVHGFWNYPFLGPIPSAVWVVGIAFVLRDLGQFITGRMIAIAAIVTGTLLSWWLASPQLALASGVAFLWSESTDALIFTPLVNKGGKLFMTGLCVSGLAASVVDSSLFLRLAFGSFSGWWQFTLAKDLFVLMAAPVAWMVRNAVLSRNPSARMVGNCKGAVVRVPSQAN